MTKSEREFINRVVHNSVVARRKVNRSAAALKKAARLTYYGVTGFVAGFFAGEEPKKPVRRAKRKARRSH